MSMGLMATSRWIAGSTSDQLSFQHASSCLWIFSDGYPLHSFTDGAGLIKAPSVEANGKRCTVFLASYRSDSSSGNFLVRPLTAQCKDTHMYTTSFKIPQGNKFGSAGSRARMFAASKSVWHIHFLFIVYSTRPAKASD
jgi:hypothetical protein